MDISLTAKGLDVPDRFREYAAEKAEKIAALADRAIALQIKVTRHAAGKGSSGDDRVELTLVGPGPLVRAEAAAADKYAAFDLAQQLANVKSFPQAAELWQSHARKQMETLTDQSRELVELSRKVATDAVEPFKDSVAKLFQPAE